MLKTIRLQNFKAFHDEMFIDFYNKQNLLIGGEKGAGKSTIFEAIKYVFFYDRLLLENIPVTRRHKRHEFDLWVGKIPWRRAGQPSPVFLPRESHGQRSLAGCGP